MKGTGWSGKQNPMYIVLFSLYILTTFCNNIVYLSRWRAPHKHQNLATKHWIFLNCQMQRSYVVWRLLRHFTAFFSLEILHYLLWKEIYISLKVEHINWVSIQYFCNYLYKNLNDLENKCQHFQESNSAHILIRERGSRSKYIVTNMVCQYGYLRGWASTVTFLTTENLLSPIGITMRPVLSKCRQEPLRQCAI
jgi:hypothetical protein